MISIILIITIPASSANKFLDNRTTIYFANAHLDYSKTRTNFYYVFSKDIGLKSIGKHYYFDADLDDFILEIVVNYTTEMKYNNINIPFSVLRPIIAFGLKIEHYSDYQWQILHLKHFGNDNRQGNVSVEIPFDMDEIKKGDTFCFDPTIAIVGDPKIYTSKDLQFRKSTSLLLRFSYNIPFLNKFLLEKKLLPYIAEHNWAGLYDDLPKIYIDFE